MRLGTAPACAAIALSLVGFGSLAHADSTGAAPARPALPPAPERVPPPWEQHLEVGGGLAIVAMPLGDGKGVHLDPGAGFHIRLSWEILRYLWFTGYLVESQNGLDLPSGSLGLPGSLSSGSAHTYTFGVRASPTLPIGSRVRLWLTAGAGWGRVMYPDITVSQPGPRSFQVRGRAGNVVEVPLGVGAAFEIIPRWLRVHLELTGSFVPSQTGDAFDDGQAVDGAGKLLNVAPMPRLGASIVQTIGLSLVL